MLVIGIPVVKCGANYHNRVRRYVILHITLPGIAEVVVTESVVVLQ